MKIEIPDKKKLVHEMRFPVRWGDMDAMGHVNNTVYFRYLETARIDWLVSVRATQPADQGAHDTLVWIGLARDPGAFERTGTPFDAAASLWRKGLLIND